MNSSKRPRFSVAELESLRLWATPYLSEEDEPLNVVHSEEMIIEPEPPAPTLTVEEIEAIQKQAYTEGFALGKQEGFEAGFVEGSKKGYDENVHLIEVRTNQLVSLLESFTTPFKQLDESVEQALAELSVKIAKRVLCHEIELDAKQISAAVKAAMSALPISSQNVKLYLNPEDADLVNFNLGFSESASLCTVIEDTTITRGGCKINTETSHIDATIENRLNAILESMFGEDFKSEMSSIPIQKSEVTE